MCAHFLTSVTTVTIPLALTDLISVCLSVSLKGITEPCGQRVSLVREQGRKHITLEQKMMLKWTLEGRGQQNPLEPCLIPSETNL